MTHEQIIANLKAKKYATTYFLAGEETFYIDLICDYIEKNVLSEGEKAFNQTVYVFKKLFNFFKSFWIF